MALEPKPTDAQPEPGGSPEGGAPPVAGAPLGPHPLERRGAAMDAIADARREMMEGETGVEIPKPEPVKAGGEADEQPEIKKPDDEKPADVSHETPPPVTEPGDKPPALQTGADDEKIEILVDGEKKLVTRAQLVSIAQKNFAADRRLEDANRLLKDARELAAPKDQPTSEPKPTPAPKADAAQGADIDWTDLAKKLQYEDPEQAGKALRDAVFANGGMTDRSGIDPDAIAQRVHDEIETKSAAARFEAEYADVIADPYLQSLVAMQVRGIAAAYRKDVEENGPKPRPPYYQVMKAAADSVLDWRYGKDRAGRPNAVQEPKPNDANPQTPKVRLSPDRQDAKRNSVQPPAARTNGAPRAAPGDQQPEDPDKLIERSRAGALAEMTRNRKPQVPAPAA